MPSKDQILEKIKILIVREFENPQEAFEFFDKDKDGTLNRKEIKALLKEAEVNRFLQSIVTEAMISELDKSDDDVLGWEEFEGAISKLMDEHGGAIAEAENAGDSDSEG